MKIGLEHKRAVENSERALLLVRRICSEEYHILEAHGSAESRQGGQGTTRGQRSCFAGRLAAGPGCRGSAANGPGCVEGDADAVRVVV